jgi:hypothetical protein
VSRAGAEGFELDNRGEFSDDPRVFTFGRLMGLMCIFLLSGFASTDDVLDAPAILRKDLPDVLIIGDSISSGYFPTVRDRLLLRANTYRVRVNGQHSAYGRKLLNSWLSGHSWAVIHFNFGLHDIFLTNGLTKTSPEDYEANLRAIVKELEGTGAALIWGSTTPVPSGESRVPQRNGDVLRYNEIANLVMTSAHVVINDLYSFILPQLGQTQLPHDVHFTERGYEVLGRQVAESIMAVLSKSEGAVSDGLTSGGQLASTQ